MKRLFLLSLFILTQVISRAQFCTTNTVSLMNGANCCNFSGTAFEDMNNDGMKDLLYFAYAGQVSIAMAVGNGSFAPDVIYPCTNGFNSTSAVVADFNSDGNKDVLVINGFNPSQQLFIGSSSGTLAAPIGYTLGIAIPIYGKNGVTDFNSDGVTDFYIKSGNAVTGYTCDGAAGFSSVSLIAASTTISGVFYDDMNGDNKQDFIIMRELSSTTEFDTYLGNGTTTYSFASTYTIPIVNNIGNNNVSARIGDYNSDGKKDIGWRNPSNNNLFVIYGNGVNGFSADNSFNLNLPVASNIYCIDFNGDYYKDLFVVDYNFGGIGVYLGTPTNTFVLTYTASTLGSEHAYYFSDLNNDGKSDFFGVADNYVIARLNNYSNLTHNNTAICEGNSATLSATGATAYAWSNGSTSTSITVSPTVSTLYTLTTTNSLSCTNSLTYSLIVKPKPILSLASGTVCKGQTFTLQPSGAATMAITGNNYVVTPTATSVYTLTGSTNGCFATAIAATVGVIPVPTLAVSQSQTYVCIGNTVQLQVSGASNYVWNNGSTTSQISVSPTITTVYTVTGTTAGCSTSKTATLGIGNYKNISGTVTSGTNTVSGTVQLYQKYAGQIKWDSVSTTTIVGNAYTFTNMPPGAYVVRALPTQTNLVETYGPSSTGFKHSSTISHYCFANANQNIAVIAIPTATTFTTGTGVLCGHVFKGPGYGLKGTSSAGNPVKGTTVKGGKNPGGTTVGRTVTNASGEYTLSGLPANAPGESYFIFVDIPGIDTNGTYHRVLITGVETFTDLDFEVDSVKSTPLGPKSNVGIEKINLQKSSIRFYPNPANDKINFLLDLDQDATVAIDLLNINGQLVKKLLQPTACDKGELTLIAGINDVARGVYLIRLNINGEEVTQKIIVADWVCPKASMNFLHFFIER